MTTIDKTGASDAEFRARIAAFDAAPTPPECDPERVETVARAIWEADPDVKPDGPWSLIDYDPETYRPMAAAAIAALPPSPAEEAVNVEGDWIYPSRELHARDLTKSWADAAQNAGCPASFVARMRSFVEVHDRLYRAALASPAPAPQGGARCKHGRLLTDPCRIDCDPRSYR